ncbi:Fic family protein [Planctomycetota bacterium]
MRMPKSPPDQDDIIRKAITQGKDRVFALFKSKEGATQDGRYLHWDELRFRPPPEEMSSAEWWWVVKQARSKIYTELPCWSTNYGDFKFATCDPIPKMLHNIDLQAGGRLQGSQKIINPEHRDRYYVSSLIEEAITSSQLEGARTSYKVAKEMIRQNRPPRDKSEQMILNNYLTMQRISDLKDQELTKELVFELHRRVTSGTLSDPSAAGRFRTDDDDVRITDEHENVLHEPPSAASLEDRMKMMCEFANDAAADPFVHPVIRAIVIHFWLAYDHPFVDGNGRTARALFYWAMLRYGYWLFEFISISRIILKGPVKYGRAFLYCETDDEDLTYFVLYHLKVIERAIGELHEYIQKKTDESKLAETQLLGIDGLNHRQRALVSHAIRHPNTNYTIQSHQSSHGVTYETARTDLANLRDRRLLAERKVGRALNYRAVDNLSDAIQEIREDSA